MDGPPTPRGYAAELLDGTTAVARPVVADVEQNTLYITAADTGERWSWALDRIEVDPLVVGATHVRHREQPEVLLTSADVGLRDALRALNGSAPRTKWPRWVVGLAYAATTAVVVALFVAALPGLSRAIARRVPLELEAELGAATLKMMQRTRSGNETAQAALERLAERLRLEGDPRYDSARVEIVRLSMPNAFTFPGGSIIVTCGLIHKAESADEVAGVLAHELEHVSERHVMTRVVRSVLLTTGWQLTVGDFSGLMAVDPSTVMEVAALRYSRDDEVDADEGALRRLRKAGISSAGFANFFARLKEAAGGAELPEWLSTHPASELRQQAAMKAATDNGGPAMSPGDWDAIKAACDEPMVDLGFKDLLDL